MDLDTDQNLFPNLIHLPAELLVQIFRYASRYEEIDVIQQVCGRFKSIGELILKDAFFDIRNNTLMLLEKYDDKLRGGGCKKRGRNCRQTKRGRLQAKVYKYRSVQSLFVLTCISRVVTTCTARFISAGVYPVCSGMLIDKYNYLLNRVGRTIGKQNLLLLYQLSLTYIEACRERVERAGTVHEIAALILSTIFDLLPCFVLKESAIKVTENHIEYYCSLPGCWIMKRPSSARNSNLNAVDLLYIMDCLQELAAVSTFQFAGAEYLGKEQHTSKREILGTQDEVLHFGHKDPSSLENAPFLCFYFSIYLKEPIKEVRESNLGELDISDLLMVLRSDDFTTNGLPVNYTYSTSPVTVLPSYYDFIQDDMYSVVQVSLSSEILANKILASPSERPVVAFSKTISPFIRYSDDVQLQRLIDRRRQRNTIVIRSVCNQDSAANVSGISLHSSRSVIQNISHRRRRSSSSDSSTSPSGQHSKIIKLSF